MLKIHTAYILRYEFWKCRRIDSARHVYVVFIIMSVISVNIFKFKLSLSYILFACEICLPSWQDLHLSVFLHEAVRVQNPGPKVIFSFFFSRVLRVILVCWLLFLITNLTDPNAQKFPLKCSGKQKVTYESQLSRFS